MPKTQDPDDKLDYTLVWTDWLGGDTIVDSTWTVHPAGLTLENDSHSTTAATVWASGGEHRTDYTLVNRVVTTAGRTREAHMLLQVRDQ